MLVPSTAASKAPRFELDWDAPAECPDAGAARARVTALLAGAPDEHATTDVQATVHIEAVGPRFRLTLRTNGAPRELEGDDCSELSETAALIVAIAIDPRVLARIDAHELAPPPAVTEVPTPPPEPAPIEPAPSARPAPVEPSPPPVDEPRIVARPRPVLGGRVATGLDLGTLPSPTAAFELSLALSWPSARLEAESSYAVRRRVRSRDDATIDMRAQAWSAGLRGCFVLSRGRLEAPLCVIARGGLVQARGGGGVVAPTSRVQPWAGAGPGVMLLVGLAPRISLAFGLDAIVAAVRAGFRTSPSGRIGRPWPVTLHAWAGVHWRRVTGTRRDGQPRR